MSAGALIADAPPDVLEQADFGEALGIGFQIKDDLLNLEDDAGNQKNMERNEVETREGKRTLITIHLQLDC